MRPEQQPRANVRGKSINERLTYKDGWAKYDDLTGNFPFRYGRNRVEAELEKLGEEAHAAAGEVLPENLKYKFTRLYSSIITFLAANYTTALFDQAGIRPFYEYRPTADQPSRPFGIYSARVAKRISDIAQKCRPSQN